MKIEKEENRVLFISENEEEQTLLTNYGYAVTPRDIKLARILYYNDKSNEPIVLEARCNLSKHPQKIIHVDFKTGKVSKPYEDMEW